MEALIVGEGALSLHEVATVIQKSTSFAVLLNKWVSWARCLGINEPEITGLKRKVNHETIELQDLPREILNIWKADKGSRATLKALCEALKESGVQDIAEALSDKFWEKSDKYLVNGKLYTLEQLVGPAASESYHSFSNRIKLSRKNTPTALIKDQVSPQDSPEYYISRSFLFRSQLDEKIFKDESTKQHIFVLRGATKSEVARLSGLQMIDSSRNQLEKITVRFIMLDCIKDFGKICELTSSPVHMIESNNGEFFWTQSTQSWEIIRNFLKETGKIVDEEDVISMIASLPSTSALSIADSPGMGKTFVLANLAKKIGETQPNAVVLFIVLQEFVKQIHLPGSSSTLDIILNFVTTNYTLKSILQKLLEGNAFQFFIFLDGYDEVLQDKLDLVDSYLQNLLKIKNIRVIITTRPHLKSRLESNLKSFSFEILPFNDSNQVDFLTKYWTTKHGAKDGKNLLDFAKKCLNKLKITMTDTERYIAGIPLQCMMLAEVYAADAKRASEREQLPEDAVQILSFFQMYEALIDLKLSKISDPLARKKYLDAHIYESITLLFPDWIDKFKLHLSSRIDIDKNTLYSIGLLEKIPFSNETRFVHRTFAEYLFADFITRSLTVSTIFVDFLFTQVLGKMGVKLERRTNDNGVPERPSLFKLKYPVIAYFLNMSLQVRYRSADFRQFLITMDLQNITDEDACNAANACCCNGLESCFDFTTSVISQCRSISDKVELKDKYFKHLIHLVVEKTNNISFVRNALNFTKSELGRYSTYHVFEGKYVFSYGLKIPNCTPLHVAIYCGKYNIVMHLLQEYGEDVLAIKHLLHVCVNFSYLNSETEIENKLSILEALVQLKKEWLEEEFEEATPLLRFRVHVKIVKKLVELGANINAHSTKYGTVLHTIEADYEKNSPSSFCNLVRWAFNNGFKLVNHTSAGGVTLLMEAIVNYEELDDETLRMLKKASADFNALDEDGDSVFYYAIRYSESIQFIQKILDYGANLHHINRDGRNAAHMVMSADYDLENYLVLEILNLLKSRGFDGWDQTDNYGYTPLMLGIENEIIEDNELLQFFHEQGVDFNAHDNCGDSVLFKAVNVYNDIDIIQKLLDCGANPNHRNKMGQSVVDFNIDVYEHNLTEMQEMLQLLVSKGFDGFNRSISPAGDFSRIISSLKLDKIKGQTLALFFKTASNGTDENGDTILFQAIRYFYDLELVSTILEQGVDINHQNNQGENAAHYYMKYKHSLPNVTLQFLKLLKSHGFTGLDQKNRDGRTPIMIGLNMQPFIDDEWHEFLHFLSKERVDFNAQDFEGHSVLFYAVQFSKNVAFIQKILDLGANTNHKNKLGSNVAHLILSCYKYDPPLAVNVLKLLKSKGFDGLDENDYDGCTPIMAALRFNGIVNDKILHFLWKEGGDFNAQDKTGHPVLFYAIWYSKSLDFVQKVIDFGANPNQKVEFGRNAAHVVLERYKDDPVSALTLLKLLKSGGFDGLNEQDDDGCTPLMTAIRFDGLVTDEIIQFLSTEKDDFNAQDNHGFSVLFYAIIFSKIPSFIQKILDYGANPNHKNKTGMNAAHLVMQHYTNEPALAVEILRLLMLRGFSGLNQAFGRGWTPLMVGIVISGVLDYRILDFLSNAGVDFNAQDDDGDTPIFYAIQFSKNIPFIQKLLDLGSNPCHRNKTGKNSAHWVMEFIQNDPVLSVELLRLLEQTGFRGIDEKDSEGLTPLFAAIKHKGDVEDAILQHFYEEKVDFTTKDNFGNSVLFYAIEFSKNLNFIQKVLDFGGNLTQANLQGHNAAHVVVLNYCIYRNGEPVLSLEILKLLESRGFEGFTEMDSNGDTPFDLAMAERIQDEDLLIFLCARAIELRSIPKKKAKLA